MTASYTHTYTGTLPTTLVSEPDNRATVAMLAHVLGTATDNDVRFLEEDCDDWRARLVDHKNRLDGLLSSMSTEAKDAQARFMRMGWRGKEDWFAWKRAHETHRALIVDHATKVMSALSHVNTLRHQESQERNEDLGSKLRALEARLRILEHRVRELEG